MEYELTEILAHQIDLIEWVGGWWLITQFLCMGILGNLKLSLRTTIFPCYSSSWELWLCTGSGKIVAGLEIGIGTMRVKEKSRFLIRHDYAYGDKGCPPRIPPKATCESRVISCYSIIVGWSIKKLKSFPSTGQCWSLSLCMGYIGLHAVCLGWLSLLPSVGR